MNIYEICKQGNWNWGLYYACIGGHLEIVNLMMSKGWKYRLWKIYYRILRIFDHRIFNHRIYFQEPNDWNRGFYGACYGGHLEIINLMISKGVNNWNWGLYGACKGGYLELVNLMISKGANDWNWGLYYACIGGYLELVNLMISKIEQARSDGGEGFPQGPNNWNWGLKGACEGVMHPSGTKFPPGGHLGEQSFSSAQEHFKIVNLMISKGANDWNWGLYYACKGAMHPSETKFPPGEHSFSSTQECLEIINLMISKGADTMKYYISKELGIKLIYFNKDNIDKLKVIEGIPEYLDFLSEERRYFKENISFSIKDLNNLILNFLYP